MIEYVTMTFTHCPGLKFRPEDQKAARSVTTEGRARKLGSTPAQMKNARPRAEGQYGWRVLGIPAGRFRWPAVMYPLQPDRRTVES